MADTEEKDVPEINTEETTEVAETEHESGTEEVVEPEAEQEDVEDAPSDETESEPDEPVKPVGRSQARIQKLSSELKSERAEREKLIAERAVAQAQLENIRQQQFAVQSQADKRDEEERLALLDPQDRALYQANQQLKQMEYRLNQMDIRRADDQDKANFHAKASHDETYGKYLDKVEKMYQDGLARGVHASREDLHSYILGQELKKDMAAKLSQKKATASKRIDTVTSKPTSARGDVAGSKKGKSEEDRLRGVLI